jgi:hypothetical protein
MPTPNSKTWILDIFDTLKLGLDIFFLWTTKAAQTLPHGLDIKKLDGLQYCRHGDYCAISSSNH